MSRPSIKSMRDALQEGVAEGLASFASHLHPGKVGPFMEEALGPQRELTAQACDDASSPEPLRAIGKVAAGLLANPLFKAGELRSPSNIELVRQVANHAADDKHTLEIGLALGGSEQPPSLRLVSYLAPLLEIGEQFAAAGLRVPRLRLIGAHAVSAAFNGLRPEVARHRAEQAFTLAESLASEFYPSCAQSFELEHLSLDDLMSHGLAADARHLQELLEKAEDNGTGSEAITSLRKLLRATSKHSNAQDEDQARILAGYAAAHGLSFHNYRYPGVKGSVKVGGQGEAHFDIVQQYMAERANSNGEHVTNIGPNGQPRMVPIRVRAGVLPPYYLESQHELTVESSPSELPSSLAGFRQHYESRQLRSGSDFNFVPDRLADSLPRFMKDVISQ